MSFLQFHGSQPLASDLVLSAATLSPASVALRSVSDLLEHWKDELIRFEFKLKEAPDPLLHLAELTVLPCAYACYRASNALFHGAQELTAHRCPLGISTREMGRYSFRYHTRSEILEKELPEHTINLRDDILDVMKEVRIGPGWMPLTRDGYSNLGFLLGTLVHELTEGELIPYGTELRQGEFYPVTEWDVVPSGVFYEESGLPTQSSTIVELYDFLWRGYEYAHLIDPLSSVSAFASRLNFEVRRVEDDAIVVWKPDSLESLTSEVLPAKEAAHALLIEKNETSTDNFRPLLVRWLHHTEQGRLHGRALGLLS